jgi:hypothetical protein
MSTRCQIGIYDEKETPLNKPNVLLYKHSDGYPEGVIPIIQPFLEDFSKKRGMDDVEYCSAWLLHALIQSHGRTDYLGHGICGDRTFHGDIEYYYRIQPSEILVYKVRGSDDNWPLIDTIKINGG